MSNDKGLESDTGTNESDPAGPLKESRRRISPREYAAYLINGSRTTRSLWFFFSVSVAVSLVPLFLRGPDAGFFSRDDAFFLLAASLFLMSFVLGRVVDIREFQQLREPAKDGHIIRGTIRSLSGADQTENSGAVLFEVHQRLGGDGLSRPAFER